MIKNIEEIEVALGMEKGSFAEAYKKEEEVSIDLEGRHFSTKETQETLLANVKADTIKTANANASELLLKEMKEKAGLEYEGRKHPDNFVKALTEKVLSDAKIEPEKKYKALNDSFEKLQTNFSNLELENKNIQERSKKDETDRTIDSNWSDAFGKGSFTIDKKDSVLLMKSRITTVIDEDGNYRHSKNGVELKNTADQSLMSTEDVLNSELENYIKPVEGGAGGGDTKNTKQGSWEALEKEFETRDISMTSAEGEAIIDERVKAGTLKL